MNFLKMLNIFIYKISDIDTNHVNLPWKTIAGPHFWDQKKKKKALNFYLVSANLY